jgi:hypothetical protein
LIAVCRMKCTRKPWTSCWLKKKRCISDVHKFRAQC